MANLTFDDRRWLAIVGIGEGGVEDLPPAAQRLLGSAEIVYGGKRHLALASSLISGIAKEWPNPLLGAVPEIASQRGRRIAVLASGDPFFFGIGNTLAKEIPASEFICIPAPSSVSLACARLGWPMQDIVALSCCGRDVNAVTSHLQPRAKIVVLSADRSTPIALSALLAKSGFGASTLTLFERLGGPNERVRFLRADQLVEHDVDDLNLMAIEVCSEPEGNVISLAPGLPDEMFEHDGQITKRELRAAALSALAPRRGELLWDIGAGSGSIAIEWMLRDRANQAVAIEARSDRAERIGRNAKTLGVPSLEVKVGRAPAALAELSERPNAIFVGGGASDPSLIESAMNTLPVGGRLVAHAVTMETEAALLHAWQRWGGELTRHAVQRLAQIGGKHAFRPSMTVTQWRTIRS